MTRIVSPINTLEPKYRLRGLNHTYKRVKLPLDGNKNWALVGASEDCDLRIDPEQNFHTASIHGLIVQDNNGQMSYTDFDSSFVYGTGYLSKINGIELKPKTKNQLKPGDEIEIGDLKFKFEFNKRNGLFNLFKRVAASFL